MKKLLFLLIIALSGTLPIFAMKRPAHSMEQQAPQEGLAYFIYEDGTDNGIWVKKELVEKCKSLKDMLEDLGETAGVKIPLKAPLGVIKLVFAILDNKVNPEQLPLDDLIDVFNLLNFLDTPGAMATVVQALKQKIDAMGDNLIKNETLQKLSSDLLQMLLIKPSIKLLETKYIITTQETIKYPSLSQFISAKSNAKGTFVLLTVEDENQENHLVIWNIDKPYDESHKIGDGDIALDYIHWSSDGNRIIYRRDGVDLVVCDITDLNAIKQKVFDPNGGDIQEMDLSPDGTKVIVQGEGGQDINFILWNISNLDNPVQKILSGYGQNIANIVFNADGKKFIAAHSLADSDECSLVLWDISHEDVTSKIIIDKIPTVHALAWSPDNNTLALGGGQEDDDKLVLYDMHDLAKVTYKVVEGHKGRIDKIIFSHDGSKIVSLGFMSDRVGVGISGFLWNISDINDIKKRQLFHHVSENFHDSIDVLFSYDGRFLIATNRNRFVVRDISDFNNISSIAPIQKSGELQPILIDGGKKVLIGDSGFGLTEELTILNLSPTTQEIALLAQMKNYTFKQQLLIYQLCNKGRQFQKFILLQKGTQEYNIFMSLPAEMRQFLDKTLKIVVYGE
ncbi:MAG TPA: WD40 repeat domain-containing protein [Candidatus Babeliales bacterium]|nr:WD40 repeat domain-containing protein [Candidatus Babeliales bacterium]